MLQSLQIDQHSIGYGIIFDTKFAKVFQLADDLKVIICQLNTREI